MSPPPDPESGPPPSPTSGPPLLRPGDRVAVVSPAGPVDPALLDAGLALLRTWDLDAAPAPHARDT
ncbi:LD-carboxypeptidase, partial [Saccharothrix longispora]|nr:LD-carboxypeptidase [Saccharothrix longispora]